MRDGILIGAYLAAIVAANLIVAAYGPAAVVPVAFVFVGFDLTLRDRLHERWPSRDRAARMLALIAAGGAISWLLNRDAGPIAVASTVAFLAAALTDWAVYSALGGRSPFVRVNGSNVASATVDSALFVGLAFGWLPGIIAAQLVAKVAGGLVWYFAIRAIDRRRWRARHELEPWQLEPQTRPDPEAEW